jgi:pyridoxamine 5'-phosphate oxidase
MALMSTHQFDGLRTEYADSPLRRCDLLDDPMVLLQRWLEAAANAGWCEPNAMALATCDAKSQPHCRMVLCKQIDSAGIVFFSNARSDKGQELKGSPHAAATFWWATPRERQIRIEGAVCPTSDEISDAYFANRPRAAQLASAASEQSRVIRDRRELEERVAALAAATSGGPVPRPAHWHGYQITPQRVEFWQGRKARLHDRFRYERVATGWHIERLAP